MEVRGADDGFATDRRDFSTEEEIRVNGVVTATSGASVVGAPMRIYLDGTLKGTVNLGTGNAYVLSLGVVAAGGSHTIRAWFQQYRMLAASLAETGIGMSLAATINTALVIVSVGLMVGVVALTYFYMTRKRRRR